MPTCKFCGSSMIEDKNTNDKLIWKCANKQCSYRHKRTRVQSWFLVIGLLVLSGVIITAVTVISNNGMTTPTVTSSGNISATYFVGSGQYLTGITGNSSWNETRGNDLYTPIKWNYNQTTATNNLYGLWWYNQTSGTYNLYGGDWYNHTIAVNTLYGQWFYNMSDGSYNASYDAGIPYFYNQTGLYYYNQTIGAIETLNSTYGLNWYNHTTAVNDLYGMYFYNMSDGSYNATYDLWAYNQTQAAGLYNYNHTLAVNDLYGQWFYNQSTATFDMYGIYWYNMTGAASGFDYNHTLAIEGLYGLWFYNQSTATFDMYGANWYNHTSAIETLYGKFFYNMSDGSYNATYALWSYNETIAINTLYGKWFYNMSDGSYNATYAAYNSTYGKFWYNMSDGSYNITYDSKVNPGVCGTGYLVQNITSGNNQLWNNLIQPNENFDLNNVAGLLRYRPLNMTWINFTTNKRYVQINGSKSSLLIGTSSFSASIWAKRDKEGTQQVIFERGGYSLTTDEYFGIEYNLNYGDSGNLIAGLIYDTGPLNARCIIYTNLNLTNMGWQHLTLTKNDSGTYFYLNGTLYAENTTCTPNSNFNDNIHANYALGRFTDIPVGNWEGSLDELRFYNKSLTADEILEIYNSGRIPNESLNSTGLLIWQSFNENNGGYFMDKSIYGNNGIWTNYTSIYSGIITNATWDSDNVNVTNLGYQVNISIINITNAKIYWDNGTILSQSYFGQLNLSFFNNQSIWILNNQNISNSGVQCVELAAVGLNITWTQALANTLYAPILWAYNQTQAAGLYNYNHTLAVNDLYGMYFYNMSDGSYNATYDALIPYGYNQSLFIESTYGIWFYNMSDGSYNASYDLWAYNQTYVYSVSGIYLYENTTKGFNFNETRLNSTIDDKLKTTYYNVTTIQAVRGTGEGGLSEINAYDSNSYNISEASGAVGLDLRINFTGVTSLNKLIFRYKSSSGENHQIKVQIYDYVTGIWENYATLAEVLDYNIKEIGIYDPADHLSGETIQLRFYQSANGNTGHKHYFDWVTIAQGPSTPAGTEIDPYSFHRNESIDNTGFNITASYANITDGFISSILPIIGAPIYIGSEAVRWLKGWFVDIDVSGNVTIGQNVNVSGDIYQGNLKLNSTGYYSADTKLNSKTADVVVCRGTSVADDLVKEAECDVVCKSDDDDCGDDMNNAIIGNINNGTIFIKEGLYNIETNIPLRSNIHLLFENKAIFNNTNISYQIFRMGDTSILKTNIIIDGGEFNCQGKGCWYSSGNFTDLKIINSIFNEGNITKGAQGIEIFFDAYAPYNNLKFQNNLIQGNSSGWDMIGSGLIYYSDFSNNIFRNGDGQGIGVNIAKYTTYKNNKFYSVGNIIGMEGFNNSGNIIDNNIAYNSGNIKLSLIDTDSSNGNIVSNNQLYYGGGIEAYNGQNELITGNLIDHSIRKGIYGCLDKSTISNNKLVNTATTNQVANWNGTVITDGGILLLDCYRFTNPTENIIIGNTLIRSDDSTYSGGIAIGNLVSNTQIINNKMINVYDGYKIAEPSYIDNFMYNQSNEYAQIPTCSSNQQSSTYGKSITIYNDTGNFGCTCTGGTWKCQPLDSSQQTIQNLTVTNMFNVTSFNSNFGDGNKYITLGQINLSNTVLGDIGSYPMISGHSDDALGNLLGINSKLGLISSDDNDPQIAFTNTTTSSIGIIVYNVSGSYFYTTQSLNPETTEGALSLGSSVLKWFDGWFNGTIYIGENTSLNDSGLYYAGSKASVRTADVVVCRGTNALDDLIKGFTCDVVCKSDDTNCADKIQAILGNNKNIYLRAGTYPFNLSSDTYGIKFDTLHDIYFEGNNVLFNVTTTVPDSHDVYPVWIEGSKEIYVKGIKIDGNQQTCTTCMGILLRNSENVYFDNIDIKNMYGIQFMITATTNQKNINIFNSKFTGLGIADVIGGAVNSGGANDSYINIHNNLINQTNVLGDSDSNAIVLVGAENSIISNNLIYGGVGFGAETKGASYNIVSNNVIYPVNATMIGGLFSIRTDNHNNIFSSNVIHYGQINTYGYNESYFNNVFFNDYPTVLNKILDSGNNNFIDNYNYNVSLTSLGCNIKSAFDDRTIHNSSTQCTCVNAGWKCWGMQ